MCVLILCVLCVRAVRVCRLDLAALKRYKKHFNLKNTTSGNKDDLQVPPTPPRPSHGLCWRALKHRR